ncbi:asparagine synthase (glutamine-hydrolyzing) [Flammeovirgaceae bacterium SG7u.111]|nr:asparagine synthase (glutamine-hydrolyzing) [Flammeovirgaceae bacterium SG7u.132]WPO35185.1 asparagine synthase (glutamine-hydrolyzing) [Flammeovirgaceae bacterium SG7u.111]
MCGFTGVYAFNELGRIFTINTHNSNEKLAHRGPDAAMLFSEGKVSLGHRRLSILDLSSDGNQPMSDPTGRYTIAFNGEIYNFQELRGKLQQAGISFKSQTDTEVLLQLYIRDGEKCLNQLNGFFTFAIFDQEENSIFIARDRFGIKPLVYYLDEDKLLFASELNALKAYNLDLQLDHTSLYQYLQLNYIPAPNTIYKNTFKLMPGHFMKVKGREIEIKNWYEIPETTDYSSALSYDNAKSKLIDLLDDAVQKRMISDVPLGAFLSGGIDSSVIVALASQHTSLLNTFSVGFSNEPLFDETAYAEKVANKYKTNHTVFNLTNDDFFQHITDLLDFYGEPFADSSAIPVYILSKYTRQKVTVALSGDGADEIFAGYHKHFGEFKARENALPAQLLKAMNPILGVLPKSRNTAMGNKIRQFHRFSEGMKLSPSERYWFLCSWNAEQSVRGMLNQEVLAEVDSEAYSIRKAEILKGINGKDFNEFLRADMRMTLPNDMLHKVDSMSMAQSLEVRVPFLDHRLVEFAFGLPASYKIRPNMKKVLLQDAARHLLPEELYNRPKRGFEVPLAKGFKRELRSWIENECLNDSFVKEQKIFDPSYIKNLKHTIFNTTNFDQNSVWTILAFQHWWRNNAF